MSDTTEDTIDGEDTENAAAPSRRQPSATTRALLGHRSRHRSRRRDRRSDGPPATETGAAGHAPTGHYDEVLVIVEPSGDRSATREDETSEDDMDDLLHLRRRR